MLKGDNLTRVLLRRKLIWKVLLRELIRNIALFKILLSDVLNFSPKKMSANDKLSKCYSKNVVVIAAQEFNSQTI